MKKKSPEQKENKPSRSLDKYLLPVITPIIISFAGIYITNQIESGKERRQKFNEAISYKVSLKKHFDNTDKLRTSLKNRTDGADDKESECLKNLMTLIKLDTYRLEDTITMVTFNKKNVKQLHTDFVKYHNLIDKIRDTSTSGKDEIMFQDELYLSQYIKLTQELNSSIRKAIMDE